MSSLHGRTFAALMACTTFWGAHVAAQDIPPQEKARTATGTVAVIQKETRQFVLKGDDGSHYILSLDERTSIRDRDKDVRFLDLGLGAKVTVTYNPGLNQYYAVSVVSEGKRSDDTALVPERPREASPVDAVPITVKGRIEEVKSDLTEVTVKTFDDKVLTFQVDEDTRNRYRTGQGAVPTLKAGTAVTAVYLIGKDGTNRLVTLTDIAQQNSAANGLPSGADSEVMPRNARSTTNNNNIVDRTNQPNVLVRGGAAGLPYGGLPLIGGAILPAGFTSTTNNVAGSLNGTIAQNVRGLMILSTSPMANAPTPQTGDNRNPANTGGRNNPGGSSFVPARADLFAVVAVNSREPFILDGSTRILLNNQPIQWQALREGAIIQAHFNVSGDGSKVVHTIVVTDNRVGNNNAAQPPMNPNNQPGARDRNGNPTQPNQVGNQGQGRGIPPAGQFPPLPNQTGNASNANPAGTNSPATNADNVVSGRIARMKFDSMYLQRSGNDFSFFTTRNSVEPLRVDNGSRFVVNNQQVGFNDLPVGGNAQVFVEFVNNVRRVIGISVNSQNVQQTGGQNP